jgi:hypothetical protein
LWLASTTGDVAGIVESPVYAILQMNGALDRLSLPEGYRFEVYTATPPADSTKYAMKWDGEWHITYEVFREMGLAFAAVLVLIYILVVGWFQSFLTPVTIMAAIPFSLVGILPAHAALGAFFTATSMIGFIAGAGIVVRNSIILVDFIELRVADGMPLEQAVVDENVHDCRTCVTDGCRSVRAGERTGRLVGPSLLPVVHGVRRPEPVSVGVHQLVPDDVDPAARRAARCRRAGRRRSRVIQRRDCVLRIPRSTIHLTRGLHVVRMSLNGLGGVRALGAPILTGPRPSRASLPSPPTSAAPAPARSPACRRRR